MLSFEDTTSAFAHSHLALDLQRVGLADRSNTRRHMVRTAAFIGDID